MTEKGLERARLSRPESSATLPAGSPFGVRVPELILAAGR